MVLLKALFRKQKPSRTVHALVNTEMMEKMPADVLVHCLCLIFFGFQQDAGAV